jgi:prepilin-type N-terminal cleavage/methylation domain-containing protein
MKSQHGFTMIELLVSMAIVAVLTVASLQVKHTYDVIADYQDINQTVNTAAKAAQQYYRKHCSSTPFVQPSQARLQSEGFVLNQRDTHNVLGTPFTYSITNIGTNQAVLSLTSSFSDSNIASAVSQYHTKAASAGTSVVWRFDLNHQSDYANLNMTNISGAYGELTC